MKPISALDPASLSDIKLISFDADGVVVEKGTEILTKDNILTVKTRKISRDLLDKLIRLKKYFHINISSGRSLLHLKEIFELLLWENASLQGENGIFTLINGQVIQPYSLTLGELEILRKIREEIELATKENRNIRGLEPKQFLISIHCFNQEQTIAEIVKRLDKKDEFYVKWNSEAYDIFPKRFSKGTGLIKLAEHLEINISQIMVVGNDPNDREAVENSVLSVTTSPDTLKADYYTEGKLELGGEKLVNQLLKILE